MLPPFLLSLTPATSRGHLHGIALSGPFSGNLISRRIGGVTTQPWGWCSIYGLSAAAMLLVTIGIHTLLPALPPAVRKG